ncbi:DnaD domain protein [Leuconostocaceae bacterium ESL0723]|nr:DnaD domain protein [Leuconostocaceae bacterium ESL0723]
MDANLKRYLQAGQTSISNALLQHYRELGLDNDDLVLYLQVQNLQSRGDQARPDVLARTMQVTEKTIIDRLKSLMARHLLVLVGHDQATETYDFSPLYDRLIQGQAATDTAPVMSTGKSSRREVLQTLEVEFGRPLTPMEMQTVSHWFDQDHFDPNMMLVAIQEAIANNARSLRYIEAILANWQQQNIKTPQAAQMAKNRRQGGRAQPDQTAANQGAPRVQLPTQRIEDM